MEDDNRRPKPIERKVIASPEDYEPLSTDCQVIGAFNSPLTIVNTENGLEYLLMPRVAEIPIITLTQEEYYLPERRRHLPYFEPHKKVKTPEMRFDKIPEEDILDEGEKEVKLKGHNRLKHISLPRLLTLNENLDVIERQQKPAIYPEFEYERFGIEDVRITKFNDKIFNEIGYRYGLTYVTPHRTNKVSTYTALTNDFIHYKKLPFGDTSRRVITGKDMALFPEKLLTPHKPLGTKSNQMHYVSFNRPEEQTSISPPSLGLAYSPDLTAWWFSHDLNGNSPDGKTRGTGTPPVRIGNLWVTAFHEITSIAGKNRYNTRLMGLDLKNPWKIKYVSDIFVTRDDYVDIIPKKGYVPHVVYTTGFVEKDGRSIFSHGIDDFKSTIGTHYTEDIIKFLKGQKSHYIEKKS